jgi:hypothetical protein
MERQNGGMHFASFIPQTVSCQGRRERPALNEDIDRAMLQAGRSRVRFPTRSMDFLIDLILPVALWPWGRLTLYQK